MQQDMVGKKILIVKGSLLPVQELEAALVEQGAAIQTVTNIISAFSVIERDRFDGAVIDQGLHNQAFDFCTELQSLNVPYITCGAPHGLQSRPAKERDAQKAVASLRSAMRAYPRSREGDVSDFYELDGMNQREEPYAVGLPAARGSSSMAVLVPDHYRRDAN